MIVFIADRLYIPLSPPGYKVTLMMAQSVSDIGRIVAAARRHRQLTQAQLGRSVGASQNWISEVETGKPTAQIGKVLSVLGFLGVRLQVGEAPWLPPRATAGPARGPSLDDIISRHCATGSRHKKAAR
jgi:HTH-type transcriptional regulator/antitoxin HipB